MPLNPTQLPLISTLGVQGDYRSYTSNIGCIIVPEGGPYAYKAFYEREAYDKELAIYRSLDVLGILVPSYEGLGERIGFFVLQLENIRHDFARKDWIRDLDMSQVASILHTIHTASSLGPLEVSNPRATLIVGDVHASNFFEVVSSSGGVRLGILDFSSMQWGEKEEDMADIYIDLSLDDLAFQSFLRAYPGRIDREKVYRYAFLELKERIKQGMNISSEKKKEYFKYMLILKEKIC